MDVMAGTLAAILGNMDKVHSLEMVNQSSRFETGQGQDTDNGNKHNWRHNINCLEPTMSKIMDEF